MDYMTFNDMLHRAAWRKPDHNFIHWSDRSRNVTYAQGEILSDKAAGMLANLGVKKGDRVALFANNGLDYVLAMFGIWKLGAISAHISILQKDHLDYFIHDSSPTVLIYAGEQHAAVEKLRPEAPELKHYICFDGARDFAFGWNELLLAAPTAPDVRVTADDPAHLSYTSGSAGPAKGALLAHGFTARATLAIAERLDLNSEDISLGVTSLASSFHLVANLLPGIHRAVSIGVRKQWEPAVVWEEMEERRVTYFAGNPLVLSDLLTEIKIRGSKPIALKKVVSGGASVPPELKKAYYDELKVPLVESYGQSELGGFLALGYPRKEAGKRMFAIGPGLPDRETKVVDEQGREQPVGQPGELIIRGGVMVGYWNMPEKTASVMKDGWLHTGDMGTMDSEGYFTLLGRWSERIVSAGKVIYPRTMEEALLSHPAVHYAGVIGRNDAVKGQIPLGIVELFPDKPARAEEILAHCRKQLGDEDSPTEVIIIFQMPMTPTGKIGKQELIRIYGQ
jgi:acyl-coenzyme A synthetase/AMP-(fatty) acid ligase